jgi:DNA-directed RNA polymerase specialized sigma24 family protein
MEKIQRLEDKLAQIDSDLIVLKSPAMSSEPKSSVKITLTDKLIQREELEDKINTLLKYARQDRTDITRCIDALDNQKQALVLDRYFIGLQSLEEIADDVSYSCSYVTKLYIQGVQSISVV